MYIQILVGFAILISGAVLSRLIQAMQFKRIGAQKRDKLFQNMRRLRSFTLVPALVAVMLFIVGVVVMPESFVRLVRLMAICGVLYVLLLNILVTVHYFRVRCGVIFVVVALFAKAIVFVALILFGYLVITAFQ